MNRPAPSNEEAQRQGKFENGSRRRKEADFGGKNTSASLPRRLRSLRRFLNSRWLQTRAFIFSFGSRMIFLCSAVFYAFMSSPRLHSPDNSNSRGHPDPAKPTA